MLHDRLSHARRRVLASASGATSTLRFPDDLFDVTVQRLGITSIVLAFTAGLLTLLSLHPDIRAFSGRRGHLNTELGMLIVGLSLVVFLATLLLRKKQRLVCNIGLIYEVAISLCISLNEYSSLHIQELGMRGVSSVCMWMTLFRLVVPVPPLKGMIASFLTASTGPLALLFWVKLGTPLPPTPVIAYLIIPNYITLGFSSIAALLVFRMGTDVSAERALGSYILEEQIGHGGMGEVRRARHRMLARKAAIKLISPEVYGKLTAQEMQTLLLRFEREAQVTAALQSPHTVELFDFGVANDGSFFYVMELLSGMDLETLVKTYGPMPNSRVIYLLLQICDSLDDAHSRGLVHRDIKPANLFDSKRGKLVDYIKVLDFGLVKVTTERVGRDAPNGLLTAANTLHGTPAYISPEMVTGDKDVDARSDLYSLGCVAYFLLTGHVVFEASGAMNLVIAHVTQTPEPPSRLAPFPVDPVLEQLVMQCLEKDPARRPQSALELAEGLEACQSPPWTQREARAWWQQNLPEVFTETEPCQIHEDNTSRTTELAIPRNNEVA